MDKTDNPDTLKIPALVPLPTVAERRRRDNDPKVRLMYAQRKVLASALEAFCTFVPLRKADFDDVVRQIAHYRESLCPCGKPSVPGLTSPPCEDHSPKD